MKSLFVLLGFFLIATQAPATAQSLSRISFEDDRWEIIGDEVEVVEHLGKESLFAKGGGAILRGANFENGVISFAIALSEQRAFPGMFFRMENDNNYEEFYIRPHQSGNPDASQYTPVYNGISGWQLYHGEGYSGQIEYEFDEWMPIKVVVKGDQADIYVKDMDQPFLHVNDLKREPVTGDVGLRGTAEGVYFSNFRFSTEEPAQLIGKSEPETQADASTITRWAVSDAFSENMLDGLTKLGNAAEDRTWSTYETEPSGLMNMAQANTRADETNTAFARQVVTSESASIKKMTIAYSDRVRVYLNGRILYSGQNEFRSRDYRYLGTVGYFDNVYLPLEAGQNELLIAVSENFGGWGIKARFADSDGITWGPQ